MGFWYKPNCPFDEKFSFVSDFYVHLIINGCWPTDGDPKSLSYRICNALYTLWSCQVIFSLNFTLYAECMYVYENSADLGKVVGNMCLIMIALMVSLRLLYFRGDISRMKRLLTMFAEKIWIDSEAHPKAYERAVRRTKPTFYISLSLWICLVLYLLFPIIFNLTQGKSPDSNDKPLPFPTVFPYDTQTHWAYIFTYIFLSYAGYIAVSLFYAMDAILAYFISFVVGQFEILHADIARLIPECHAEWLRRYGAGAAENGVKLNYLQEMYAKRLHGIAKRHKDIIAFCKELEKFMSFPLFANYGTSTFLICFVGFQFMIAGLKSFGDFMRFFMFFMAVTGQLFIVCKLGNLLITQSTDTAHYLFACNWEGGYLSKNSPLLLYPDIMELQELNRNLPLWKDLSYIPANRNFKLKLMFMIMRSNRPVQLSVMQFTVLSLQSFNKVVSNSLSYFALLKSFLDK